MVTPETDLSTVNNPSLLYNFFLLFIPTFLRVVLTTAPLAPKVLSRPLNDTSLSLCVKESEVTVPIPPPL